MGRLRTPKPRLAAAPERVGRAAPVEDRAQQNQAADRRRGSARARGYDAQWARTSADYRARHPLCEYCLAGAFGARRVTATELVDHLYPARDYPALFWAPDNHVSSCNGCHSGPKQALEARGDKALLDDLARRLARTPFAA